VPLFIALIICLAVYLAYRNEFSPDWWIRMKGLPRPVIASAMSKPVSNLSNSISKVGVVASKGGPVPSKFVMASTRLADRIDDPTVGSLRVEIKFDKLRLVSGTTTRLADVSGHIKAGKFTAILGGSGAGKTSLMNAILAREKITSGNIQFQAQGVDGDLPQQTLNRIIGFVPQTDVLIRSMTVYQGNYMCDD
jgi:ABC-type bacteriocin/lantibiotic exporter with double-glycine peptidase domain